MNHVPRLTCEHAALAVIDMQEAFRLVIPDYAEVAGRIAKAVQGALLLDVPVIVTEQYPRGLRHTAEEIQHCLPPDYKVIEKICFNACDAEEFVTQLIARNIKKVMVCGIEAHICVAMTSLDLLSRGYEVYLLDDCITSRRQESKEVTLARLTQAGAVLSNLEMALFEMMRTADIPQFKALQNLIK